jgi:UDP-N-acetylmuramate dehydrogenase
MSLCFKDSRTFAEVSTFGIGGEIAHFAEVSTLEEMREGILFAAEQELPLFILGRGSNCLFPDSSFPGVVLHNKIDFCTWEEESTSVYVGAGYNFALLGVQSARKGWSGLEFASGIPASVGGAIFMNAGASGSETCDALTSVTYMDFDGELREYARDELKFRYRISPFQKMEGAIVAARFSFVKKHHARDRQIQMVQQRMETQPLKEKSIGCVFRNPSKTVSAGFLIEQCGLKGISVGGAQVSPMHANFIVNASNAKASDVRALIAKIQETVLQKTGIELHPEIRQIHE